MEQKCGHNLEQNNGLMQYLHCPRGVRSCPFIQRTLCVKRDLRVMGWSLPFVGVYMKLHYNKSQAKDCSIVSESECLSQQDLGTV